MRRKSKIQFKALLLASFGFMSGACGDKCLRHTDCDNGAECLSGACVIVLHGDAGVAPLTPAPSETQQVPSTTAPVPSATAPIPSASEAGAVIDGSAAPP